MRIICFLSLLLFALCGTAQENQVLIRGGYAVDSVSAWKINEVASKEFIPFNPGQKINIGYNKNTAIWCKFIIQNPTNEIQSKWLCFDNNHLDSIVIYDQPKPRMLGDRTKFISPYLDTQAFEIKLQPSQQKIFFAKVKKGISFFEFDYQLRESQELAWESRIKIALVSFFLGIIFILVLFNSILFFISRTKMYLYYILYSVLSAIYILISSYYAKSFLFPEFIYFSELRIYTASFWIISMAVFLSHYMNIKKTQPRKYRIVYGLNILNIFIMLITISCLFIGFTDDLRIFFFVGYINFLIIIGLVLWSAIINLKIHRSSGIYVLIAFLPQSLWGIGIILKSFRVIDRNMPEDALVIICLYEVFLFGYVLTKSYIDTFRRNNALIQEIIWEKENSLQAITQAQIRERRNVANIIHDNLGSKLAYISQLIQLKNHTLANQNLQELSEEVREISHKILPKSLDEGALVSSLKSQINIWNNGLTNTKIEIFSFDFPEKINEPWIYDMYLISTEIINNSIKHGMSTSINIEWYDYPDSYLFQFTDDGIGYNTNTTPKGFGLENIEKRIEYYKGTFEINSAKNEGTIVQVSLPKLL